MAHGCKIPVAVHWIVIRLSSLLRKEDISIYTGISLWSVEQILHYFKMHQTIQVKEPEEKQRKRLLRDLDVEVSIAVITFIDYLFTTISSCLGPSNKYPTCISMKCKKCLQRLVVSLHLDQQYGEPFRGQDLP
jgi:hypothetical protein